MMNVDPTVLGGAVVGLVTLQLTSLGIVVALLRFFYRRLDRRFAEVRSDIDRRFTEVDRRFTEVDRRFTEAGAGLDRRFAEVRSDIDRRFAEVDRRFVEADVRFGEALAAMQAGFAEARDDRRRLEEKLDEHGKEVARLQGIVERTYEPHRFTVGMPDKPLPAPPADPDAPGEPPADPTAVGNR